jgi:DNA-binding transcriptional LysR family regulator
MSVDELRAFTYLSREEGSSTRQAVEDAWHRLSVAIRDRVELPSWEALKTEAARGTGFLACSRLVVEHELRAGSLVTLDVRGWKLRQTFFIVKLRGVLLEAPAEAFMAFLGQSADVTLNT